MTVPRCRPRSSLVAPRTGTWATSSRLPSQSSVPDQPRPAPTPFPSGSRSPSTVGFVELTTRPSPSATVTDVTRDCTRAEYTSGASASAGEGPTRRVRTSGWAASCSASAPTRRPSTRLKVASDCASETAATAISTTTTMASCNTSISPASV